MKSKSSKTWFVATICATTISSWIMCTSASAFAVFQDPFAETRHSMSTRFPDEFRSEEIQKKLAQESSLLKKEKTISAASMDCHELSDLYLKAFDIDSARAWSARYLSLNNMAGEQTMAISGRTRANRRDVLKSRHSNGRDRSF